MGDSRLSRISNADATHPNHTVASCVLAAVAYLAGQQPRSQTGEWPSYGGTNWSQKYSPLDQITRDNFSTLSVAWTWQIARSRSARRRCRPIPKMPLHANGLKGTPLVVNGVMYMSSGLNQIVAIDPVTGATKWLYNPEAYKDGAPGRTCSDGSRRAWRTGPTAATTSASCWARSTATCWRSTPRPASRSSRSA